MSQKTTRGAKIPWSRARKILLRDGFRCRYCGKELHLSTVTIDHIIPRTKGGTGALENLVVSCRPCNNNKGDEIVVPRFPPVLTIDEVADLMDRGNGKKLNKQQLKKHSMVGIT